MKISKLNPRQSIALYAVIAFLLILVYSVIFVFIARLENQTENADILTAIYWVVTTMTTVGYGDIVLTSNLGRGFSIFVQISGLTILFGMLFPFIVIPWLENTIKISLPVEADTKLNNHIIICGYNRFIEVLIDELRDHNISFLIVDNNEDKIRELMKKDIPCIYGNPGDEETLLNARIKSANSVITNKSDEENADIILTAHELSDIKIITLAENILNAKYLKYAGANRVVSPKSLFGYFIGKKAVDPLMGRLSGTTEFFDGIKIVEFPVYPKSRLIGYSLGTANIHERTGAVVVGIWEGGELSLDPKSGDWISENTVLLAVGTTEQLSKLKQLLY